MNAPLHLVRLSPNPRRLAAWAHGMGLIGDDDDLGYAIHAGLCHAFGEHAPKPFRLQEGARSTVLYGYVSCGEAVLNDHARTFADPLLYAALGIDSLAAKEMPDHWRPGHRLGFEIRTRPVVRQDKSDDRGRTREVDAFLAACAAAGAEARVSRDDVYRDWLSAQLERIGGARLVNARLVAFKRTRGVRRAAPTEAGRLSRPLRRVEGPDAVLSGLLEVTGSEAFSTLLARGIGRHRAFGYGMLLLRPPPQA